MNMEIDIPTAVIVSAVWILFGLALLARRYAPAKPRPTAAPRGQRSKKKIERQNVPAASDA